MSDKGYHSYDQGYRQGRSTASERVQASVTGAPTHSLQSRQPLSPIRSRVGPMRLTSDRPELLQQQDLRAQPSRYSYLQTPIEMSPSAQAFSRHAPSEPAIPQSPVSPMEGSPPPTTALPPLPNFASYSQTRDQGLSGTDYHENSISQTASRNTPRYSYLASPTPPPLDREHPAFSAPYAEPQPLQAECPQAEPLPNKEYAKPPIPQTSEKKVPFSPDHVQVPVLSPRTPTTPYHPTYDPPPSTNRKSTAPGPHQPGQIPHPNMAADSGWKHGLCEFGDIGICCTGLWCPCILYGKTQYRLSQKDPTDLLGYKTCNGSCGIMCVAACGFQWVFAFLQRTRVRKLYNIDGSVGSDCITAFCCHCCVLIEDEREVRDREEELRQNAGPVRVVSAAYPAPPPAMTYLPQ